LDLLSFEDESDRLYRNVGTVLPQRHVIPHKSAISAKDCHNHWYLCRDLIPAPSELTRSANNPTAVSSLRLFEFKKRSSNRVTGLNRPLGF
jgi:hypothetical protein